MNMENWNPMAFDYHDKQFNSYDRGPGRHLPRDPAARQKFTNLYVTGIPEALNEDGIRNLFRKYGTVKSCKIRRTPNYVTNMAFVMMETLEQCSEVIHMLNGHKIGNDRLSVKFAKTAEDKEKDRREKEGQDKLIKSLGSGRTVTDTKTGPHCNTSYLGGGDSQKLTNKSSRVDGDEREAGADVNSLHPYVSDQFFHGCELCGKEGSMFKCANCLVWYCSAECQNKHWPLHKPACVASKSPGAAKTLSPPPPPADMAQPLEKTTLQPQTLVSESAPTKERSAVSISLPLNESIRVKLVEFQSPGKFFVQIANNVDMIRLQTTLNQAIECSLYGLLPYMGGTWTDFAVQACTKHGLVAGELYSLTCVNNTDGNQVLFTLRDESDLGDRLVQATAAIVDPLSKYRVWDSLHRHLTLGAGLSLKLEPFSVEGVGGFYATISNDELKPYLTSLKEMEEQTTLYGREKIKSNVWNETTNRLPDLEDHVLCECGERWLRAEVVEIQGKHAAVAFLDNGSLSTSPLDSLLHIPRCFSHLPAVAVKININGVKDSPDEGVVAKAIEVIQESIGEREVQAVMKDYSLDALSLQISLPTGADLASTLLSSNLAVKDDEPLKDSLLSARVQAVSPQMSVSSPQKPVVTPAVSRSPLLQTPPSSALSQTIMSAPVAKVSVEPLLSVGNSYNVHLCKLDGTVKFCVAFPSDHIRCLDQLSQELFSFYSTNDVLGPLTPSTDDYVAFQHSPGEWRRGLVKRTASNKRIALVFHLDFEHESSKISYDALRMLLPRFAAAPYQALPVCQLENVTIPQVKNAMLKPYMRLPVDIEVMEYTDDVYIVRASYQGQPLQAAPDRRSWMLEDVEHMAVPSGQFEVKVVDVISPSEIYIAVLNREVIESCLDAVKEAGAKAINDVPPESLKRGEVILMFVPDFEEWDRAVVLDTLPNNELDLQSVDYGSKFKGNLCNARPLTEELAKKPLLAIRCGLAGWTGTPNKEAFDILCQLRETSVDVEPVSRSPALQVRMLSKDKDVFEMIKHLMPAVPVAPSPPVQSAGSKSATKAKENVSAERLKKLETLLASLQAEVAALREERDLQRQEREG